METNRKWVAPGETAETGLGWVCTQFPPGDFMFAEGNGRMCDCPAVALELNASGELSGSARCALHDVSK